MKVAILAGSQSFSYNQGMHDFTIEEVNDIEEASSLVQETIKDPDVSIKKMNEYSGFLSLNQAYLLTALCDFFGYVIRTIGYIK